MTMSNRAAQFAPFSALSGYDEVIKESAQENASFFDTEPTPTDDIDV
jgi:hypothetical protein